MSCSLCVASAPASRSRPITPNYRTRITRVPFPFRVNLGIRYLTNGYPRQKLQPRWEIVGPPLQLYSGAMWLQIVITWNCVGLWGGGELRTIRVLSCWKDIWDTQGEGSILTQHGKLHRRLQWFLRVEGLVLGLAGIAHVVVSCTGFDPELGRYRVAFALCFDNFVFDGVWK